MNTQTIVPVVSDDTALVSAHETIPTLLIKPIATIDSIVEAYQEYQLLKTRLLSETDYQLIKGKKFIKKS
jgi:hypothetical protein